MDWKDKLGAAFGVEVPTNVTAVDENANDQNKKQGDARQQQGNQMVHVVVERKGRAGKVATIVTDLKCDEQALKDLASQLKQQLGVGGSARGGEILIQGDLKARVIDILRSQGFKVK